MNIYRPKGGALQRLTPNAGNRRFVRGGLRGTKVKAAPDAQGELELEVPGQAPAKRRKGKS